MTSTILKTSVSIFLLFFSISILSQNWQHKVEDEIFDELASSQYVDVIIHLQAHADLRNIHSIKGKREKGIATFNTLVNFALQSQKNLLDVLKSSEIFHNPYWIVNAVWAKLTEEQLEIIALLPEVKLIGYDPWINMEEPVQYPEQINLRNQIEWGIQKIGADEVWEMGYTGQGVVIGGQDTGYDWTHPTLSQKYRGWDGYSANHNYNWHDAIHEINPMNGDSVILPGNNRCGLDIVAPCDDHNHGTHTMGTMVGDDGLGNQIGVAPGAKWIGCRNMERGAGKPSTYLECFEWFLAPTDLNGENPDPLQSPHVINNSWSCPPSEGCNLSNFILLETAINNLRAAGVVVVTSAGNEGSQGCSSVQNPPSIFSSSFAIGATNSVDTLASFSSKGPVQIDSSGRMKPDLSGPGVWVRSARPDSSFTRSSGTSMAGPHVAGSVALLISAKPELAGEVSEIEDILKMTASPAYPDTNTINNHLCGDHTVFPNPFVGYGRVDIAKAVKSLIPTGISVHPTAVEIKIQPNPFDGFVELSTIQTLENPLLELITISGQRLLEMQLENGNKWKLQLGEIPDGAYLLKLTITGQGTISKLLIKNNAF